MNENKLIQTLQNFEKECLKLQNDFDFYLEGLKEINGILTDTLRKISELDFQLQLADEEEKEALIEERKSATAYLKTWNKEYQDYLDEYNRVATELEKLKITTANAEEYAKKDDYARLIRALAAYSQLKQTKDIPLDMDEKMQTQLNGTYQNLFATSEKLIQPHKEDIIDTSFEIIDEFENKEVVEQSEEEDKTEELRQEFEAKIKKGLEIEKEPEHEYVPPTFLKNHYDASKEQEQNALLAEIEKRTKNYEEYLQKLYTRLDKSNEIKHMAIKQIEEKILNNESYDEVTTVVNEERKIVELITEEIRRVRDIKEEEKKDIHFNMNIPGEEEDIHSIIDHLKNKEEYQLTPPKEKTYPTIPGVSKESEKVEEQAKEEELVIEELDAPRKQWEEDLERIQNLRKKGFSIEEIKTILASLEPEKDKKEMVKEAMGKAFTWVKKSSQKTKDFVKKNKKKMFGLAIGTLAFTAAYNPMNKKVSDVTVVEAKTKEENQEEIRTKTEMTPIDIVETASIITEVPVCFDPFEHLNFGDEFTISSDSKISKDEYLDELYAPYYSPDTKRTIIGFGLMDQNGIVKRVYDQETRNELLKEGYQYVSVQSFDGFFNINDIAIEKGLSR